MPARQHPYWATEMDPEGQLSRYSQVDGHQFHQKQSLPPMYFSNSSIHVAQADLLLCQRDSRAGRSFGYVMDEADSLDIDSVWDLKLAELILQHRLGNGAQNGRICYSHYCKPYRSFV